MDKPLVLLLVGFVACGLAFADAETIVTGEIRGDGTYELTIDPSDHLTDAILIYSEPSATLLVAVLDIDFLASAEGRALETSVSPLAQVEGDLPSIAPTVLLPSSPPETDTHVRTVVYGQFHGIRFSNDLLGVTETDRGAFGQCLVIESVNPSGGLAAANCRKDDQ